MRLRRLLTAVGEAVREHQAPHGGRRPDSGQPLNHDHPRWSADLQMTDGEKQNPVFETQFTLLDVNAKMSMLSC